MNRPTISERLATIEAHQEHHAGRLEKGEKLFESIQQMIDDFGKDWGERIAEMELKIAELKPIADFFKSKRFWWLVGLAVIITLLAGVALGIGAIIGLDLFSPLQKLKSLGALALVGLPKYITIHCSGNHEGDNVSAKQINDFDIKKWGGISYHFIILLDGTIVDNLPVTTKGRHVANHNTGNIGICYIGGLDKTGKIKDTRTDAQKAAMLSLVQQLQVKYGKLKVMGHRDWSPDKDGDGKIEPNEWLKGCPSFDVKSWLLESQTVSKFFTNTPNDTLNVRMGAGADYDVIGKLPHHSEVKILNSSGNWKYIQCGKIVGWVSGQYLKTE